MGTDSFLLRILLIVIVPTIICGCPNRNQLSELEKWDLVYISDSTGWGVAERYAENIGRDTRKAVQVKDYAIGGLSAIEVLDVLHCDPEELMDLIIMKIPKKKDISEMMVYIHQRKANK